jgi:hypothetical protein
MRTAVGVFQSRASAQAAAGELRRAGFSEDRVSVLMPGASEEELRTVPASEMEQPGVGKAIGGVVGAAVGAAGGAELGFAAATALLPGIGPVMAVGLAGAALLGIGGAAGGAAAGAAVDRKATEGLPADEIFFYEDALRQGRSVVVALAEGDRQAAAARDVLVRSGAETLDAARQAWWIGLRSAEEEHYRAFGGGFDRDEAAYRRGFEAALRRDARGRPCAEATPELRAACADVWESDAFQRGYERGQAYYERHWKKPL